MAGLTKGTTGDAVQIALGQIAKDVQQSLEAVQKAARFMAQNSDAELLADYGISSEDAALLRSAISDLDDLAKVYRGQQAVATARNFNQNVRRIVGLGF